MRNLVRHSFAATSLIAVLLLTASCASGPALEKFPERQIERPFTLPKGVAAWKTQATGHQTLTEGSVRNYRIPFPIPLIWHQALSDELTLEWSPLPLGLRYQLSRSEAQVSGLHFLAEQLGYGTRSGWFAQLRLEASQRRMISETLAIEGKATVRPNFGIGPDDRESFVNLSVGPYFQLSPSVVLSPKIQLQASWTQYTALSELEARQVFFPIGLYGSLALGRRWEVTSDLTAAWRDAYDPILGGFSGTERQLQLSASLIHYW